MRDSVMERSLCSNKCWHFLQKNVISNPTCIDIITSVDTVDQDHSIVVVGQNVAIPKSGKSEDMNNWKTTKKRLTSTVEH